MFTLQVKNEEISIPSSSFATGQRVVIQRPASVNIKVSRPFWIEFSFIEFYRIYWICRIGRILFSVILKKMKITENSILPILQNI